MMRNQFKLILALLFLISVFILIACGAPARNGDAAPLQEEAPPPSITPTQESTPSPEVGSEPVLAPEIPTEPAVESEPPMESRPKETSDTAVINFNISGGIVGFCDTLTVNESGEYLFQSCQNEELTGILEQEDLEALQTWSQNLVSFDLKFEDNPGGPDNLVSELSFSGQGTEAADEVQRQIIFDWVNGLLIRVRPQPVAAPPTAEPPEIGPDGLCPEITRPAMLIADYENPSNLILVDPDTQTSCDILLPQPPFGRIVTAAGRIYYPIFDPEAETVTIWQLSPNGEQLPLNFTEVSAEQFGPLNFILSADGTKIAWGRAVVNFDVDPPIYRNDLWLANIDGSEPVTIMEQVENSESRYVEPVRFTQDNATLYYALQPDGLGGPIFSFGGRFDNLYEVPAAGGQAQLLFACSQEADEQAFCVGDISPDGEFLAYTQSDQGLVQVMGRDGSIVASLTPPATDYIGPALFGPSGHLAFVSAILAEVAADEQALPQPNPGYISFLAVPYTGELDLLLMDNSVATAWEWLDENRLAFGSIDDAGNIGTSVVTIDGQVSQLSPNFALAVLR